MAKTAAVPQGQRAERVGDLDRHRPAKRERPGHAADALHARRDVGQLGQDERHDDPEPVGPDHGVEGLGYVDQHPDQDQPPISVPMIMINVGQLTRRGSTSFGTSIDLAWAAR